MTDTRDLKNNGQSHFSSAQTRSLEKTPTRLAHWPPPFRSVQAKPKIIRHQPNETPKRATLRGWRLTRAMFSEFEES
jgi:hypothetical protein